MNPRVTLNTFSAMKLFTIEEANSLLPSVRPIVRGIQRAHRRLASYQSQASAAAEGGKDGGGGGMANGSHYAKLIIELSLGVGELESLGVQLKDYSRGLIDFPSIREGRVVLLCWRADEGNQLEWWHDVEAGFAGRQPL